MLRRAFCIAILLGAAPAGAFAQVFGGPTTAAQCAVAVGDDISRSTVSVVCGIPPSEVATIVGLSVSRLPGDHSELMRRLDLLVPASSQLRAEALASFFMTLGEADVPPERLRDTLVEIAQRHQDLLAQLEAAPTGDPEIEPLKSEAEASLRAGELDRADELLAKVQDLQDAHADRLALEAAATRTRRAELALTRLRYREAAELFAEAARRVPPAHEEQRRDYLQREAMALFEGYRWGDAPALREAVDRFRTLAELQSKTRDPVAWAHAQLGLGMTLMGVGALESEPTRLAGGIAAMRLSLDVYSRAHDPEKWANVQGMLCAALSQLGAREPDGVRLEEAVVACRLALEELSRERDPQQWVGSQMWLSKGLMILGSRDRGSARLVEAVDAARLASE